jgi:hypothetical protein
LHHNCKYRRLSGSRLVFDRIPNLTSKISSLPVRIVTATPAEEKRYLVFLKDFWQLKTAVEHVARKKRYLLEIEKFEKLDE